MPGLYILPDMRGMSIPGQVPKLHAREPSHRVDETADITTVRSEGDLLRGLTMDSSQENFIRGLLSAAMSAENEVTLRQDLMTGMIEKKINPGVRRTVLSRAVELFRETRVKPRVRMLMRKGEDSDVSTELASELDAGGGVGMPLEDLAPFIAKYGHESVIRCLKQLNVEIRGDYLVHPDHADRYVLKAEPEVTPKRSPRWGGGSGDDDRAAPVGTRKVWGKRIVEKKEDGKWHVVGIVPGLEDPKKVEAWDVGTLSREALQHVVRELATKRAEQATDEPTEKSEKAKRGKSTPAPPSHRVRGSKVNKPRSAESSASGADIELTESVVTGLKNKVKEHNDKVESSKHVTLGALKSVWRRGAGAFSVSHRPGMTRQQWAMGRVNAFLELVRTGKPKDKDYVTDNDLLPRSMRKSESGVTKLNVFDFDATLFRSPSGSSPGWWISPRSLAPPCVPEKPGAEWWNASIVAAARRSMADPDARTVLITGRAERVFRARLMEILASAGLKFDDVLLNTGDNVPKFKAAAVKRLLEQHSGIDQVKVWDDSSENHSAIEKEVEGRGLTYTGVKPKKPKSVDCADDRDSKQKSA